MRASGAISVFGQPVHRFFKPKRASYLREMLKGFTLVELIVVITILAILATVGFLSLAGYSDDARSSVTKANVRMVYTAIATESATSGNSPRYYIEHDSAAALAGKITVGGTTVVLTGGAWNAPGTNYSAGNPRWELLRLNPEKFRVSSAFGGYAEPAFAAYDSGAVTVGAVDALIQPTASGKKRTASVFQVAAASPKTKKISTMGNYSPTSDTDLSGLVKDTASTLAFASMVEGGTVGVFSGGGGSQYPGCDTPDIILSNGQVWAACNVGATVAFTWQTNCPSYPNPPTLAQKSWMGWFFQWWRNDDVTLSATTTTKAVALTSTWSAGFPEFVTADYWFSTKDGNLWWGASTTTSSGTYANQDPTNRAKMQGPCADGYHVPTDYEWGLAMAETSSTPFGTMAAGAQVTAITTKLKLPMSGRRDTANVYGWCGWNGEYWSSTPDSSATYGYLAYFAGTAQAYHSNYYTPGGERSVRCMKN